MSKPKGSRFLVASLVALLLGFLFALNTEGEELQMQRVMAGLSVGLWALAVLLAGVIFAIRIESLYYPIVLGVIVGVLPALSFATLHLLPLATVEEGGVLILESISEPILLPLQIATQGTNLFLGIYSSHATPRHMIFSWLGVTVASGIFWGLVVGFAAAVLVKTRNVVASGDGTE